MIHKRELDFVVPTGRLVGRGSENKSCGDQPDLPRSAIQFWLGSCTLENGGLEEGRCRAACAQASCF